MLNVLVCNGSIILDPWARYLCAISFSRIDRFHEIIKAIEIEKSKEGIWGIRVLKVLQCFGYFYNFPLKLHYNVDIRAKVEVPWLWRTVWSPMTGLLAFSWPEIDNSPQLQDFWTDAPRYLLGLSWFSFQKSVTLYSLGMSAESQKCEASRDSRCKEIAMKHSHY
jgi:hypothetical protein